MFKSKRYRRVKPTTYVYGVHELSTNKKEYIWRIPRNKKIGILPGDKVLVNTQYGKSPIIVTRIEDSIISPINSRVSPIICKLD